MLEIEISSCLLLFAYDTFATRTSKTTHEIVDGFRLKQPIDFIPISNYYRVSEFASSIASSVASHVQRADVKNRLKTFNVCDVNKLHGYSADPFQILNKLNENTYVVYFDISSTFNVKNLVDYRALYFILLIDEPSPELIF